MGPSSSLQNQNVLMVALKQTSVRTLGRIWSGELWESLRQENLCPPCVYARVPDVPWCFLCPRTSKALNVLIARVLCSVIKILLLPKKQSWLRKMKEKCKKRALIEVVAANRYGYRGPYLASPPPCSCRRPSGDDSESSWIVPHGVRYLAWVPSSVRRYAIPLLLRNWSACRKIPFTAELYNTRANNLTWFRHSVIFLQLSPKTPHKVFVLIRCWLQPQHLGLFC